MNSASDRAPNDVLQDHLDKAKQGSLEQDIFRNYAEDVVLLGGYGIHRGHEGVRFLAKLLEEQLPGAHFQYETVQVEEDIAFLEWTASANNGATVKDGADSFVIRNGKITAQTIHYTLG
jgi:hypothetical protein